MHLGRFESRTSDQVALLPPAHSRREIACHERRALRIELMKGSVPPSFSGAQSESSQKCFARHFLVLSNLYDTPSGLIAGNLHATKMTSSRTRWSRTRSGAVASKKYAFTASTTLLRSSSQESACVKMLSVRLGTRRESRRRPPERLRTPVPAYPSSYGGLVAL